MPTDPTPQLTGEDAELVAEAERGLEALNKFFGLGHSLLDKDAEAHERAINRTNRNVRRLATRLSALSAELEGAREKIAAREWIPIDDTRRPTDDTPILAKTADGRCMVFSGRILATALKSNTPDHLTFPAIAWMRVP